MLSKKLTGGPMLPIIIESVSVEAQQLIRQFVRKIWEDLHVFSLKTSKKDNTII